MGKENASGRLIKGTIVYMIGNLTSKALQMLILPIITAALATEEYGTYDLLITTINLVTPLVTLQITEGMFRFIFEASEGEKKNIVSTSVAFLMGSSLILGSAILTIKIAVPSLEYPILIYLNYVSVIIFEFLQKFARCQKQNKVFAISGVVNTITMLGLQVLSLLVLNMHVDGMLIANVLSYLVASLYMIVCLKPYKFIAVNKVKKGILSGLLKYSAPLVPNSIGWWFVASSDRYVISYFLGASANGIYSIAGKFSLLLTFVTTVFQLAWQESAIIENSSNKRDEFYTNTFNTYMKLLMGGYLVILPLIKIVIPLLLDENYQIGYLYNPILLVGAVFSAFSQFYGSSYMVFRKTQGALYTTILAAIVNLCIGIGLIECIGLYAPALGTAASFLVQWIVRAYQMKDYFRVKIQMKDFLMLLVLMMVSTTAYYLMTIKGQILSCLIGVIVFIIFNKKFMLSFANKILQRRIGERDVK